MMMMMIMIVIMMMIFMMIDIGGDVTETLRCRKIYGINAMR